MCVDGMFVLFVGKIVFYLFIYLFDKFIYFEYFFILSNIFYKYFGCSALMVVLRKVKKKALPLALLVDVLNFF